MFYQEKVFSNFKWFRFAPMDHKLTIGVSKPSLLGLPEVEVFRRKNNAWLQFFILRSCYIFIVSSFICVLTIYFWTYTLQRASVMLTCMQY